MGRKGRKRRPPLPANLGHPRYWGTWFGLGLLRLLNHLPIPLLNRLADGLGILVRGLLPERRHIARVNLELAFPDYSEHERRRLERNTFKAAGRGLMEGGLAWWAAEARLAPRYTIEGLNHLEEARAQGRGVILLGGHYSTLEISGRLLARHVEELYPIYKPAKNPAFNATMLKSRRRTFADVLRNDDMRAIVRVLRRGGVVWYAPDQDFGRKGSVFAPFMGVETATLTMTARLARVSGAPMVPFYSERRPGHCWHLELAPVLEDFPSGDDVADAARINKTIEHQVRRTPEQYLWIHRRFKTRPERREQLY